MMAHLPATSPAETRMTARTMKLGLNIVANGAHSAGWRLPDARADAALDFALWKRIAQAA